MAQPRTGPTPEQALIRIIRQAELLRILAVDPCVDQVLVSGLWAIGLFVGIDLIFYGGAWIALALGLRSM